MKVFAILFPTILAKPFNHYNDVYDQIVNLIENPSIPLVPETWDPVKDLAPLDLAELAYELSDIADIEQDDQDFVTNDVDDLLDLVDELPEPVQDDMMDRMSASLENIFDMPIRRLGKFMQSEQSMDDLLNSLDY